MKRQTTRSAVGTLFPLLCLGVLVGSPGFSKAADHGDGPTASNDQSADIADVYFFVDPNDNTKVVIIGTMRGFIVPGEAVNFGIFDPTLRYRFEIENNGDAKRDEVIDITFGRRLANSAAQVATIRLPGRAMVEAPATNPSLAATPPSPVVTDLGGGVSFFAGEVDDPFFFDIPGFARFVGSVLAGAPNVAALNRGRNTFAGYNIMAIAFRIPVSLLRGDGNTIGVDFLTERSTESQTKSGEKKSNGPAHRVDRAGNPAVNVALVPFADKNRYNAGTTKDDARGRFASGIVGTLQALGTSEANIGVLANVAVNRGDFLRLDTTIPNTGPGGGDNPGAGFPNGRRLVDDVVDTLLFIITNGAITEGDHTDANDVAFRDVFPFVAAAQQPREGAGNVEDNTRN